MRKELLAKILVCDDDAVFRRRLARSLRDRGYEVYEAEDARSAIEVAKEYQPQGALVDLRLVGENGLWLVGELGRDFPEIAVVVFTGFGSINTALDAVRLGAKNYITKPASIDIILESFFPQTPRDVPQKNTAIPSLAEVETEYVNRVLAECDGNVSQSAKLLGVARRSLQRRMRK